MGGRWTDPPADRIAAAATPGPGEYGAPMPFGGEMGGRPDGVGGPERVGPDKHCPSHHRTHPNPRFMSLMASYDMTWRAIHPKP
jgi:hypothetical protein